MQIRIIRTQWVNDDHKDQNVSHLYVVALADNASKNIVLCVNHITYTVYYDNYENAKEANHMSVLSSFGSSSKTAELDFPSFY